MPFTSRVEAGVLHIHATGTIHLEDARELRRMVQAYLAEVSATGKGTFLCDMREFKIYAPDAAGELLELMKRDNPRLHRAAFLVSEGAGALQIRRMVRESGSDRRQIFASPEPALAWLRGA